MKKDKIEKRLDEIEKTLRELKGGEEDQLQVQPQLKPYVTTNRIVVPVVVQEDLDDPCANCPNNPMNNPFASGFCNCALPYMGRHGVWC